MDLGDSDKFEEAGFTDYNTFKKEINAVATALLKDFKDDKLFKSLEIKLKNQEFSRFSATKDFRK